MAKYVDGFVIPVPKGKIKVYKSIARKAASIWKKYGALDYFEAVGDDLNHKGMTASFPKLAKAKSNETVIFAWIVYKSKAHRNSVNKKVMKDPYMMNFDVKTVPFDSKRMAYGGFKVLVEA